MVSYHYLEHVPEAYAVPVQTIPRAIGHNPPSGNSSPTELEPGSHIYTDLSNTNHGLPDSTVPLSRQQNDNHYSTVTDVGPTADLPMENYSHLEHSFSQKPQTSLYNRLDHSPNTGTSPTPGELYSSLEDSTAPLYNRLEMSDTHSPIPTSPHRLFDDPNYANVDCKQSERGGEGGGGVTVHPHYTGDYERAPDFVSPSIPITGEEQSFEYLGDYERDPNYQPGSQMPKQSTVPHEYSTLMNSTLDSPQEYTIPQH